MTRIDVARPRLLQSKPAVRVHTPDGWRFCRVASFPGGRVVQDGTAVWVEVDGPVTVDDGAVDDPSSTDGTRP